MALTASPNWAGHPQTEPQACLRRLASIPLARSRPSGDAATLTRGEWLGTSALSRNILAGTRRGCLRVCAMPKSANRLQWKMLTTEARAASIALSPKKLPKAMDQRSRKSGHRRPNGRRKKLVSFSSHKEAGSQKAAALCPRCMRLHASPRLPRLIIIIESKDIF
jgi:hypothetical protein